MSSLFGLSRRRKVLIALPFISLRFQMACVGEREQLAAERATVFLSPPLFVEGFCIRECSDFLSGSTFLFRILEIAMGERGRRSRACQRFISAPPVEFEEAYVIQAATKISRSGQNERTSLELQIAPRGLLDPTPTEVERKRLLRTYLLYSVLNPKLYVGELEKLVHVEVDYPKLYPEGFVRCFRKMP